MYTRPGQIRITTNAAPTVGDCTVVAIFATNAIAGSVYTAWVTHAVAKNETTDR